MTFGTLLPLLAPELFIGAFTLILLLMTFSLTSLERFRDFRFVALVAAAALAAMVLISGRTPDASNVYTAHNGLTHFGKMLCSLSFILLLTYLFNALRHTKKAKGGCVVLFFAHLLGAFLLISANHLLVTYLALELMVLSSYWLILRQKKPEDDEEANSPVSFFYLLVSGGFSALFLLGIALIYTAVGALSFDVIAAQETLSVPFMLGSLFVVVGLLSKLAIAPFHFWAPDVYRNTSAPAIAQIAMISTISTVIALIRLMEGAFRLSITPEVQSALMLLAALSMLVGAFLSMRQTSIKRLIAYLSITHAGFILAALSLNSEASTAAAIFYLIIYSLAMLGVFGTLTLLRYRHTYLENIEDLVGLSQKAPALSASFMVFISSLAGLPLCAGFFAKLALFQTFFASNAYALLVVAGFASLLSLVSTLGIAKAMYLETPTNPLSLDDYDTNPMLYSVVISLAALTLLFGLFPDELMSIARAAL